MKYYANIQKEITNHLGSSLNIWQRDLLIIKKGDKGLQKLYSSLSVWSINCFLYNILFLLVRCFRGVCVISLKWRVIYYFNTNLVIWWGWYKKNSCNIRHLILIISGQISRSVILWQIWNYTVSVFNCRTSTLHLRWLRTKGIGLQWWLCDFKDSPLWIKKHTFAHFVF